MLHSIFNKINISFYPVIELMMEIKKFLTYYVLCNDSQHILVSLKSRRDRSSGPELSSITIIKLKVMNKSRIFYWTIFNKLIEKWIKSRHWFSLSISINFKGFFSCNVYILILYAADDSIFVETRSKHFFKRRKKTLSSPVTKQLTLLVWEF